MAIETSILQLSWSYAYFTRFINKLGHIVLVAHTRATIPGPFATECWAYLDREIVQLAAWPMKEVEGGRDYWLWEGARTSAYGRLRVSVATAQDESMVVAPMRLQSRANWTNKRLVASYCRRYRPRYWWRLHHIPRLTTLETCSKLVLNLCWILILTWWYRRILKESLHFENIVILNESFKRPLKFVAYVI